MKRILVAEDRPASLELIRTVLESAGYEVIEAVDGQEAVEKASEQSSRSGSARFADAED